MTSMENDSLGRVRKRCDEEPFRQLMGIEVLDIGPGHAKVTMQFEPRMQNIFGMLHGGAVFSLLDEAFQLACNARGEVAVAQEVNTYFVAAAHAGARLLAEARELNATRKTALYEVRVTDAADGRLLASAQALAFRKGGRLPFDRNGKLR